jgi:hypothetical protein
MAVMHILVLGYSEGKMHEPYFYTGKQATIIHCFQQPRVGWSNFFGGGGPWKKLGKQMQVNMWKLYLVWQK